MPTAGVRSPNEKCCRHRHSGTYGICASSSSTTRTYPRRAGSRRACCQPNSASNCADAGTTNSVTSPSNEPAAKAVPARRGPYRAPELGTTRRGKAGRDQTRCSHTAPAGASADSSAPVPIRWATARARRCAASVSASPNARPRPSPDPGPARAGLTGSCAIAGSYESAFVPEDNGLDAVAKPELGQDACHVGLDGGLAEHEPCGDLGVGQTPGDEAQDL